MLILSTSSWVRDNQCHKNVSKFKSVQKHYNNDPQSVRVTTQSVQTPYKYWLQSNNKGPYIRFVIPGEIEIAD